MRLSFPHMGNNWIAFKSLFEELGYEVVVPPKITKKTLAIGVKNSPETICLPFKITLGSVIEAADSGADKVFMLSTNGPCRFGEYARLYQNIIEDMGYSTKIKVIGLSEVGTQNKFQVVKSLSSYIKNEFLAENKKSYVDFFRAFLLFYKKVTILDRFEKARNITRAHEINKGETDKLFAEFLSMLQSTKKGFKRLEKAYAEWFSRIAVDREKKLRIVLTGEIFVNSEPEANLNIEKKLNDMGIEVFNESTLYSWIDLKRASKLFRRMRGDLSNKYLKHHVGGEGLKCLNHIIHAAKKGYDGVIHIYPFTCMPEVTIKTLIPKISKDYKIPVLSLNIDEQTGEAGFMTRIEAFVDMIGANKK